MNELLSESVFFGICITIGTYQLGCAIQKKWKLSILNPLLIATVLIIGVLLLFRIDYSVYEAGSKYISVFLTPVTVCLALPLYRQIRVLRKNIRAVLLGILSGCVAHVLVMLGLAILFRLDKSLLYSLLPKSITTPIAIGISSEIGGIQVITIVAVVIAGILGAAIGPLILKVFRITEPIAQGLGMGAASHAVGTSKAMEMGEIQGAMSSLAIVVTGIMTVILVPALVRIFESI